jgi:AcrR family transcriptional regulator
MSPAALYVHFPSKTAVLFAISRSGHEQALDMVRGAVARDGGPEERMRLLVEEFAAWHAHRHRVARVVQYELNALPEQEYAVVAELRRQTELQVRDLIGAGMSEGTFTVPDVRMAARAVLSLCIDVARWYSDSMPQSPSELGAQYAALVLQMLGAR